MGQAERMVQTTKRLLKRATDPYQALLSYRATPLPWCGLSPAELSMGRRLRTAIPQTDKQLTPEWSYLSEFRRKNDHAKRQQKAAFDCRHRVTELPDLPDDTEVWVASNGERIPGRVTSSATTPRSYLINTPSGTVRRNRQHLNIVPTTSQDSNSTEQETERPHRIATRSQTGTAIRPPERLA